MEARDVGPEFGDVGLAKARDRFGARVAACRQQEGGEERQAAAGRNHEENLSIACGDEKDDFAFWRMGDVVREPIGGLAPAVFLEGL